MCARVGEVTKNTAQVTGMDLTFRTMLMTRLESGVGAAAAVKGENLFSRDTPADTYRLQPTAQTSLKLGGPPPIYSVPSPPPPPPSLTSAAVGSPPPPPPPPPPMSMTTGTPALRTQLEEKTGSSSANAAGNGKKTPKTYSRIPITEELLRSIVLKPAVRRA